MQDLIDILKEVGAVQKGDVVLKSGKTSNYYIDIKLAYGFPEARRLIIHYVSEKINPLTTCIAGAGYGGNPLATLVSDHLGLNLSLIRLEEKTHGIMKRIESYFPNENDYVTMVDDVFTTGTSLKKGIKILEPTKATILECLVLVKRGEGELPVPLSWVLTAEDLLI